MLKTVRTILLVDDNIDDIEHLQQLVDSIDDEFEYSLLTADDGPGAFQIYQTIAVDCILIDYNMPLMNGVAVAKSLAVLESNKNTGGNVPLRIISGMANDDLKAALDAYSNIGFTDKDQLKTSQDVQALITQMLA